jgi:membrane associated rhomboid family serine protease
MIDTRPSERSVRERWPIVLYGVVGLACGAWSYGFGDQIGGPLIGVVAGLNGAVFGTLLTGAVIDRIQAWRRSRGG